MDIKFKTKLPFMKNSRQAKAAAAAHTARLGKDPYFDWTIILCMFIVTAALCVSFAFALWQRVLAGPAEEAAGTSSGVSAPPTAPSFNSDALQKAIDVQSQKSLMTTQYEQGYTGPSDPSL